MDRPGIGVRLRGSRGRAGTSRTPATSSRPTPVRRDESTASTISSRRSSIRPRSSGGSMAPVRRTVVIMMIRGRRLGRDRERNWKHYLDWMERAGHTRPRTWDPPEDDWVEVHVFYFADMADQMGRTFEEVIPPDGVHTVDALLAWLRERGGPEALVVIPSSKESLGDWNPRQMPKEFWYRSKSGESSLHIRVASSRGTYGARGRLPRIISCLWRLPTFPAPAIHRLA